MVYLSCGNPLFDRNNAYRYRNCASFPRISEENIYDLAIKTLTDVDNITPEIISYLENTLGLIINWEKYHLEEGGINIVLLL
jgi:hypothetical protein